ncbi:hypothetical protein DL98DRAFT_587730 [Cadophora sp. DSE1049]|nr:hypothetical protein DL98DRAFT_587730 [Cadophora sp. DSE1049]
MSSCHIIVRQVAMLTLKRRFIDDACKSRRRSVDGFFGFYGFNPTILAKTLLAQRTATATVGVVVVVVVVRCSSSTCYRALDIISMSSAIAQYITMARGDPFYQFNTATTPIPSEHDVIQTCIVIIPVLDALCF